MLHLRMTKMWFSVANMVAILLTTAVIIFWESRSVQRNNPRQIFSLVAFLSAVTILPLVPLEVGLFLSLICLMCSSGAAPPSMVLLEWYGRLFVLFLLPLQAPLYVIITVLLAFLRYRLKEGDSPTSLFAGLKKIVEKVFEPREKHAISKDPETVNEPSNSDVSVVETLSNDCAAPITNLSRANILRRPYFNHQTRFLAPLNKQHNETFIDELAARGDLHLLEYCSPEVNTPLLNISNDSHNFHNFSNERRSMRKTNCRPSPFVIPTGGGLWGGG